jgi:uncharacterized protein involved in exopolysaccharide biosynthesis
MVKDENNQSNQLKSPSAAASDNIFQLFKRRRLIIWNTTGFAVLSVIIALILPKWYASYSEIITAESTTQSFISMLSGIPTAEFGLGSLSEDISSYIAILESRSLRQKTVEKFDLVNRYDSRDIEFAMEALGDNTLLEVTDEGTLIVSVYDKDPVMARDMVVFMLEELDRKNIALSSELGKFNRTFLEERLEQNKEDLEAAEDRLRVFQEQYGLIDVPNQILAAIEVYSDIYTQKVQAEIQFKVASATFAANDPKVLQYKLIIDELEGFLKEVNIAAGKDINIIGFEEFPELALEYARLFREVELQSRIMEFILPQYEQARMEESKNIPSLQIIDYPQIPINKAKPQRALIVISTTFMAFIMSILYVLLEYRTRELRYRLKRD